MMVLPGSISPARDSRAQKRPFRRANAAGETFAAAPPLARTLPDSVRQRATAGPETAFDCATAVGEAFATPPPFGNGAFRQPPPARNSRAQKRPFRRANAAGAAFATQPPFGNDGASGSVSPAAQQPGAETAFSPCECRRRDFRNRAAFCKIAFRQCSPVSNSRRCGNSPRLPFKRRREDFCGTCALRSSLKIRQAAENAREKTVLQGGGDASQSEKHANHKTFASVKGLWPFGLLSVTHQKTACAEEMAKAKALPRAVPYAPSTSSSIAESGGRKRARPARRAHAKFVYSR